MNAQFVVTRALALPCLAALLVSCTPPAQDDGTATGTGTATASNSDTGAYGPSAAARPTTRVRFSLPALYQPKAALCEPSEVELAQPPAAVGLLRACRPSGSSPSYVRLVNISDTTLGYGVGRGLRVTTAPPEETRFADAAMNTAGAVMRVDLKAFYNQETGWLYLPARFSAVVRDNGQLRTVQIHSFPALGRSVSDLRAISRLAAQMPYAKLADQEAMGARIAGCALQAAKSVNDRKLTFQEAVKDAQTCQKMVDDLRQGWQHQRAADIQAGRLPQAGLPEGAARILAGLSHEAGPMNLEWQIIESTAAKTAAQLGRPL